MWWTYRGLVPRKFSGEGGVDPVPPPAGLQIDLYRTGDVSQVMDGVEFRVGFRGRTTDGSPLDTGVTVTGHAGVVSRVEVEYFT